jgi:hypothetical protein
MSRSDERAGERCGAVGEDMEIILANTHISCSGKVWRRQMGGYRSVYGQEGAADHLGSSALKIK